MKKDILYQYALDATGQRRHIKHLDAPRPYQCGDCGSEMIAKRGQVRRWHYAHKANVACVPKPDPDNALHQYAQDIIIESFRQHQSDGAEYRMGTRCSGFMSDSCSQIIDENIALPGAVMEKEVSIIPNTRSDVVLTKPDGIRVIIEVVNTHPVDPNTRKLYECSSIQVFVKNLTWENLNELHTAYIADTGLNIASLCIRCNKQRRDREVREAERMEILKRRKRIVDAVIKKMSRVRQSTPKFHPWFYGKEMWGRPVKMFPKTQRLVFANAVILTELGFVQHNPQKPWLFRYKIRDRIFLYADLGGSDVVPIYEDTAAMLYIPDLQDEPEIEQYVINEFGNALQDYGVDVRTGFIATAHVDRREGIDSTCQVDESMLNSMVVRKVGREHGVTALNVPTRAKRIIHIGFPDGRYTACGIDRHTSDENIVATMTEQPTCDVCR